MNSSKVAFDPNDPTDILREKLQQKESIIFEMKTESCNVRICTPISAP